MVHLYRIVDKHLRLIVGKYFDTKFIKVDAEVSAKPSSSVLKLRCSNQVVKRCISTQMDSLLIVRRFGGECCG